MKNFKLFKEGKIDINNLKKKYLVFVIKNIFEPNMDYYLEQKIDGLEPHLMTYLLKNEYYGYMIKAVYDIDRDGTVDKEHFLYQTDEFAEENYYLEDDDNDEDYEYTSFIEDYSEIIQTINMEQYINSMKQTRDALIKLNESSNNIEKIKEVFYRFSYPMLELDIKDFNEDIEYYSHVLYKINGIYTVVRNVIYDQDIEYIVFVYDKKDGSFKNSNFTSEKEEKAFLDHADEVHDLIGSEGLEGIEQEDDDIKVIVSIDIFDWEKIIKEREDGFKKLNEKKMGEDIERAYLTLIDEKFKEAKHYFIEHQQEDEDDLGAFFAHLYELSLLNNESYYFVFTQDKMDGMGDTTELNTYFYVKEEKKFIDCAVTNSRFIDIAYRQKYDDKYYEVLSEVTFDDMYEILHDETVTKYSTAEGELNHMRTMEMREWLQIEEERNQMFKKINESFDVDKLFITMASKLASVHFKEMDNRREEDIKYVNVKYSLFKYKKNNKIYYLFLEDQMYDEVTMNQNRFVYIDEENEFENRDFIFATILKDNHPEISKEKAKCYDNVFSDFDKSKNEFELVIQKDIFEIKNAMDATTNAVISMNEKRVKTFESFNTNEDITKKFLEHLPNWVFGDEYLVNNYLSDKSSTKIFKAYLVEIEFKREKFFIAKIQFYADGEQTWQYSVYDQKKEKFVHHSDYRKDLSELLTDDLLGHNINLIESGNVILELDIEEYLKLVKQREDMFKKMNESKRYIKGIDTWKN